MKWQSRFHPADGSDARSAARLIARGEKRPALEFLERDPEGSAVRPPLFFIHGAFAGAWMWDEVLMPALAAKGWPVMAVSLRGHGGSEGGESLREWSLADYLDDVRRALEEVPEPPVVIGHSMGGLLAQRLVGRVPLRGLVLLGSLPPEGLFWVGPRIAAAEPRIWIEAVFGSLTATRAPVRDAMLNLLFSERLVSRVAQRHAARMQPESPRALADCHWPVLPLAASLFKIPTLVAGGDLDRLVLRPSTLRTALYHAAEHRTCEGMGHFLPIDDGAEDLAQSIAAWLIAQKLG